jgi:hypothetical protein
MADTPTQNFGSLPDTLTFGPFNSTGEVTVHLVNLVEGCPPYVENIGVPFVCAGEGYGSIKTISPFVGDGATSTTGYITLRESVTGDLTTYGTGNPSWIDLVIEEAGDYCMFSSDVSGNKSGSIISIGDDDNSWIGLSALDVTGHVSTLERLSINGSSLMSEVVGIGLCANLSYLALSEYPFATLDASSLAALDYLSMGSSVLLTDLVIPSTSVLSTLIMGDCGLSQGSVDDALVAIAASGIPSIVYVDGGTNSPPSATGLAAKSTIEGNGGTVVVNP